MSFHRHARQPQPAKRRHYDAAFRAEALHLAGESRSTQATARALNSSPKLLYQWQKETFTPWRPPPERSWITLTASGQSAAGTEYLKKPLPAKRFKCVISTTDNL
ncbi:MAG: transposase [Janthinobacterium lividum]